MQTVRQEIVDKSAIMPGALKTVHFIGIGGIGMSGIARMYLWQGYRVQGSDLKKNSVLGELEKMGARILIGHDPTNVEGADLIVYSSSIPLGHPERLAAAKKGIEICHRSEALAGLCHDKFTVAVTGTHGKTTTTSLIGMIFKEAGRQPSVIVGGLVSAFGGNACLGSGPEMIIEADESDASFLRFEPDVEVITNLEEEHLDHYGTIEHAEEAYRRFIGRLKPRGVWVGCADDPRVLGLAREAIAPCILYGFDPVLASVSACDIKECPGGVRGISFVVLLDGKNAGQVRMKVIGRHNVLNALAAAAVARHCGIDFEAIRGGLERYEGVERRFQIKYEDPVCVIADDYAHHPTEIRKTLEAAKATPHKRLVVVFQPHRYSRTEHLMDLFAQSFGQADAVIVTDIYAASELPRAGIDAQALCEKIRKNGHPDVRYIARASLVDDVLKIVRPGDLIMTMGAGDITQASDALAARCAFDGVCGRVLTDEPLNKHTTFKIGGPARFWIEPSDSEDLRRVLAGCRHSGKRVCFFGLGSNLLVSDEGFEGVAIRLSAKAFTDVRLADGRTVVCGAGMPLAHFIRFGSENCLGGFEFLAGIPGTVGGAVLMNAGSRDRWIESLVESVTVMTMDGQIVTRPRASLEFAYRRSGLSDCVILEVVFKLSEAEAAATREQLEAFRQHRIQTQDTISPSAGCVFKNPSNGVSCGKLIQEAGLKGHRIGDAEVSQKHANFIVNRGQASARDVKALCQVVRQSIRERFGIDLEQEIKFVE